MSTTKYDLIYSDIVELISTYNPEIVSDKEFHWLLSDLVKFIEEWERGAEEALEADEEKYKVL